MQCFRAALAVLIRFIKNNVGSMSRYFMVGVVVYGVEYVVYLLLVLQFSILPLYANGEAKVVAGLIAYFLHRMHTFQKEFDDGIYRDFVKYLSVLIVNIPLFGFVFYVISLIGLDFKITKVMADVFCICIAYLQARFFVFKK